MNLQEIVTPLGDLMTATFEFIIEPFGGIVNTAIIVIGFVGLFYWLATQKKFTDQARSKGETI